MHPDAGFRQRAALERHTHIMLQLIAATA